MYKVNYTYLEDCDGGYSKAIDKIETVTQYMNNVVAPDILGPHFRAVLAILGVELEKEKENKGENNEGRSYKKKI